MQGFYKYFRWLSLDIVLGAIFFLAFLEEMYTVHLSLHVYFALASAIWLIYTADHLIDARGLQEPSHDRHFFHKRFHSRFLIAGGTVLTLALINISWLDIVLVRNGALLSACCVMYLLVVYFNRRLWVKEVLVAVIYAVGIFLGPLSMASWGILDLLLILQLAMIAFLNLMVFSLYDHVSDRADGFGSLVIRLGMVRAERIILSISAISLLAGITLYLSTGEPIQLLYVMMACALGMVHLQPGFFSKHERFRTVGDGVFFLPVIFLLF